MVGNEVRYFTLETGQQLGPVSFRELYERVLREDDDQLQVRREGEPAFRSIALLPEFKDHFERHSQGRIRTAPDCLPAKGKTGA
jgi:hypothetical protein